MGMLRRINGAVLVALVAVTVGLLLSPLSREYPFFHWILWFHPPAIGLVPALTPRPWSYSLEDLERTDLRGQKALVTGANSGIGLEIAKGLSRQGAEVTLACRNAQRCFAAADAVRRDSGAPVSPLVMDMSDLSSVRAAAMTFLHHLEQDRLDMLFLNAGIFYDRHEEGAVELPRSTDGIEKVFATNVVGHHLLFRLLEPALANSAMARVVSTSSVASVWWLPPYGLSYRFGDTSLPVPPTLEGINEGRPSFYMPYALYGRSKLAQAAWTGALRRRLGDRSSVYVNAAHPGAVYTPMTARKNFPPFLPEFMVKFVMRLERILLWSPTEGALTLLYLGAAVDEVRSRDLRGKFFHPQSVEFEHPHANDERLQDSVWRLCEELVKSFQ